MGSVWPIFVILDRVCTCYKGRSGWEDHIQAVLILRPGGSSKRDLRGLSTNIVKGKHRASREADDGPYFGRE